MQGVTTAIVGFILLALAFPQIIKRSAQYYLAVGAVLIVIILDGIGHLTISADSSLPRLIYLFVAILQIFGIVLLILATGGMSAREFASNMARGYEVLRRGEEETETVIPVGPRPVTPASTTASRKSDEEQRVVYTITTENPAGAEKKKDDPGSLPLE